MKFSDGEMPPAKIFYAKDDAIDIFERAGANNNNRPVHRIDRLIDGDQIYTFDVCLEDGDEYSQLLPGTKEDAEMLQGFLKRDYVNFPPTIDELNRFWKVERSKWMEEISPTRD